MSRLSKGYLIAIIGITLWSTTGILISILITQYQMPALVLAFWRNLLVCVALIPALFLIRRQLLHINSTQIGFFAFYGFILAIFNSIWVLSVQANGAAVATVLAYSSAGFTAILAFWIFKEALGLPKIIAIILSLGGCLLVSEAYSSAMWNLNPMGVITGLLSGLFFAGYSLMGKEAAQRNINPWASMLFSFAFATLFMLLFNLLPFLPGSAGSVSALMSHMPVSGWLVLVILSFIPTVLGFGLYNTSMFYLPASTANLLATMEPVMTAIEAYFLLDEHLTMIQVFGSLLIISAVLIVRFQTDKQLVGTDINLGVNPSE
jgi:drug/metabolite transporter, DME family